MNQRSNPNPPWFTANGGKTWLYTEALDYGWLFIEANEPLSAEEIKKWRDQANDRQRTD